MHGVFMEIGNRNMLFNFGYQKNTREAVSIKHPHLIQLSINRNIYALNKITMLKHFAEKRWQLYQGFKLKQTTVVLRWRHNERYGVSYHRPYDRLLNRLFRRRSKKTSKLRVTGICEGRSPVIGAFPAQRASNAENVSIWWHHHETVYRFTVFLARDSCYQWWYLY